MEGKFKWGVIVFLTFVVGLITASQFNLLLSFVERGRVLIILVVGAVLLLIGLFLAHRSGR